MNPGKWSVQFFMVFAFILFSLIAAKTTYLKAAGRSEIGDTLQKNKNIEPYPFISGSFTGPKISVSPDPLVNYRWQNPKASDGLEIYSLKPVAVKALNPASFHNIQSITSDKPNVTINGRGTIMLDFGQVNAAWLEIDSPDLEAYLVLGGIFIN